MSRVTEKNSCWLVGWLEKKHLSPNVGGVSLFHGDLPWVVEETYAPMHP